MAQAPLCGQLLNLDRFGAAVQLGSSPLQLALILIAPLAPVQKGGAISAQQRHEVFRYHRGRSDSAGDGQLELAAAVGVSPCLLCPFTAQLHSLSEAQSIGHGLHSLHFAAHRIHQGELRLRQRNGDRQSWEAATGAHIDHLERLALAQPGLQRPEAVKNLANPIVLSLHQSGEVDLAVPLAQQLLQPVELLQLIAGGLPGQLVPGCG